VQLAPKEKIFLYKDIKIGTVDHRKLFILEANAYTYAERSGPTRGP